MDDTTGEATPQVPEEPSRRKKRLLLLASVMAGLLLIAAGAVAGVLFVLRGTGDVLADDVPEDAMIYATAYLDPSAGQKVSLQKLADEFPAWNEGEAAGQLKDTIITEMAADGLDYEADVEPWLGTQIGMALLPPSNAGDDPAAAFLIVTEDEGASEAALEKAQDSDDLDWTTQEHGGTTVHVGSGGFGGETPAWAVSDGVVIIGDGPASVEAMLTGGGSLADSSDYDQAMAALPSDRLAHVYLNVASFVDAIKAEQAGLGAGMALTGQDPFAALEEVGGVAMSVAAEDEGIAMRLATSGEPTEQTVEPHENAVLNWTPEDAYGVLAASGLGEGLDEAIKQLESLQPGFREGAEQFGLMDALDGLAGDFGLVVNPQDGSPEPAGAFMLAVDDPAAVKTFLDRLAELATQYLAAPVPVFGDEPPMDVPPDFGVSPLSLNQADPFTPIASWKTETYEGVEISYLEAPEEVSPEDVQIAYAVSDTMAVIATSPDEIKALIDADGGSDITSNDNFEAAIAHGSKDSTDLFFLDLQAIIEAVSEADPYGGEEVRTQLEPLKAFIMTSGEEGNSAVVDLFLVID